MGELGRGQRLETRGLQTGQDLRWDRRVFRASLRVLLLAQDCLYEVCSEVVSSVQAAKKVSLRFISTSQNDFSMHAPRVLSLTDFAP